MDQRLIKITGDSHYPYALEKRFPRILDHIMLLWDDDEEIDRYFMSLMVSDRPNRSGFPPDVAADIMHLNLLHAAREANYKSDDIWDTPNESFHKFTSQSETDQIPLADAIKSELQKYDIPYTQEGFFYAAETGNRAGVALFIEARTSIEIQDHRGWTPLMTAAFNGHQEIVDMLIQNKADVNALDHGGNSALHWAAFSGYTACAKRLIENYARIDEQNDFGWTPLMQAVARNHHDTVQLLIDSGANLNIATDIGYTPLHQAVASNYVNIVKLLLKGGADKNLRAIDGDTPCKLAIKSKHDAIISFLMPESGNPST
jgi:ankyrin repeat protein